MPPFDTTSYFHVKVELSTNTRISDINQGDFILYGKPELKMNSPEKKNLIVEDKSTYKILWDSKNIRENRINLYYSDNNGKKWKPIAKDISNKGYYNWVIPNLKTMVIFLRLKALFNLKLVQFLNIVLKLQKKP